MKEMKWWFVCGKCVESLVVSGKSGNLAQK